MPSRSARPTLRSFIWQLAAGGDEYCVVLNTKLAHTIISACNFGDNSTQMVHLGIIKGTQNEDTHFAVSSNVKADRMKMGIRWNHK